MKRRKQPGRRGATTRKRPARKRAAQRAAARLVEGRDFTIGDNGQLVVSVTGFERMATAVMSGRAVEAEVDGAVMLRVLPK